MSEDRDGGPAFPTIVTSLERRYRNEPHRFTADYTSEGGMTIRDWFAGQALAGFINHFGLDGQKHAASFCYQYADAMIAERKK